METLTKSPATILPLLIQFTPYEKMIPVEEPEYIYDELRQIVIRDPITCTTSSMKTWWTNKNGKTKTDTGMKKTD